MFLSKDSQQGSGKPGLEGSVTATGPSSLPCVLSLAWPHSSCLVHSYIMAFGGLPINLEYFEAWDLVLVRETASYSLRALEFWGGKLRSAAHQNFSWKLGIWKMPTVLVIPL